MSRTIAFLGLGRMGVRMAANILQAENGAKASGERFCVWNRTHSRADGLVADGAELAKTPVEAVADADVVVSILADDNAVAKVFLGDDGCARKLKAGATVVEMSTVAPGTVAKLAEAVDGSGATLLDAPVSGSIAFAEAAQLITMVGGDKNAFAAVRDVLARMTREQYYVGASGTGAVMKLAINSIIGATNQAIAEALVLAERSGIERAAAYDVMADSAVASPFLKYKQDAFVNPDDAEQGFTCVLLQKDLDLIQALARSVNAPMPQIAAANEVLSMAIGAGWGQQDLNRVADLLRLVSAHGSDGAKR